MAWTHWRVLHLVPVEVTFYDSIWNLYEISWDIMRLYDIIWLYDYDSLRHSATGTVIRQWLNCDIPFKICSLSGPSNWDSTNAVPEGSTDFQPRACNLDCGKTMKNEKTLCTLWLNYDRLWHISQDPKPQDPARPHKPDRDLSSRVTIWTFSPSWVDVSEISSHVCHVQCDQSS